MIDPRKDLAYAVDAFEFAAMEWALDPSRTTLDAMIAARREIYAASSREADELVSRITRTDSPTPVPVGQPDPRD